MSLFFYATTEKIPISLRLIAILSTAIAYAGYFNFLFNYIDFSW